MTLNRSSITSAVLCLLGVSLSAQLTWRQAGAQTPARAGHFAFFDQPRGRVAVFAGQVTPTTYGNDCWELEGNEWMQIPVPALTARGHGASCEDPTGPGNGLVFSGRLDDGSLIRETLRFDVQTLRFTTLAPANSPPPRWLSAMALDSGRGRAVLFGGSDAAGPLGDTWEWDGADWQRLRPTQSPPARANHAMAYDAARRQVVLYGGHNGQSLGDTWTYDGRSWTSPVRGGPGALHNGMLAYDANRRIVVLFGGKDDSGTVHDATWEWDGTSWRGPTLPATRPPGRELASLTYDKQRKVVTLIGGAGQSGTLLGDAWTWDGTTWTQFMPGNRGTAVVQPPARSGAVLAYSEQNNKAVLFGGYARQGTLYAPLNDTWERAGDVWQQRTPTASPPPAYHNAGAIHRGTGELCYFPGSDILGNSFNVQWSWGDGSWNAVALNAPPIPSIRHQVLGSLRSSHLGWVVVRLVTSGSGAAQASTLQIIVPNTGTVQPWFPSGGPPPLTGSTMVQDAASANAPDRVWLFGGSYETLAGTVYSNDVWELADVGGGNLTWTRLVPAAASPLPPPRRDAAVAAVSDNVSQGGTQGIAVMGGSNATSAALGDAWYFSLGRRTWFQTQGALPPARRSAAMTQVRFSALSTVGLLFGGTDGGSDFDDAWQANDTSGATTWTRLTPPGKPGPRHSHAMAYDRTNAACIVFGDGNLKSDTWRYDGMTWSPIVPLGEVPTARRGPAATWDEAHSSLVMFGGSDFNGTLADTRLLSSSGRWSSGSTGPALREAGAMVHLASQRRSLLFGGVIYGLFSTYHGDTWLYDAGADQWQQGPAGPPARARHGMAYDRLRDTVVLFGGYGPQGIRDDTWEYQTATGWQQRMPAHRPPARYDHMMAYDEGRGRVVMCGGLPQPIPFSYTDALDDFWEWDGSDWLARQPETIGIGRHSSSPMVYDAHRARLLSFGGSTRSLSGNPFDAVDVLAEISAPIDLTGRGNTASPESLRYYSQPVLGQPLRLGFANPQGLALLGLALGPVQQPLLQLGAPLCELSNLYALTLLAAVAAGGEPNVALGLPSDPSLHGLVLVMQGLSYQAAGCFRATDALNVRFD